ncbi:MAG: tRNA dihydrouridine synthase DusB [Acidimicrobiales bacterium]
MTLKIGPLAVDPPVVLAPMAGVTNAAFRQLCRRFGGGLYVSEMITARAVVEGNARTWRMLAPAPGEWPRSTQLYAVDPAVVYKAVRILVDRTGVDHVDLNFGCPAPKVTRKGGGAALPAHPVLFARVVAAAVRAAGPVPVTVKLRTGIDAATPTAVRAGCLAEDAGAAGVTLHARHAEQRYAGAARWQAIAELKVAVASIPVLGNGDIWEGADAVAMRGATGCDGVVVGRGCLGRPWLFADLGRALAGEAPAPPRRLGTVTDVMVEHAVLLAEHLGEAAGIRDFRKHVGWYLTGYAVGSAARRALVGVSDLAGLRCALGRLDRDLTLPDEARRLPRGHTDGPRPVALPPGWLERPDDPDPPTGADGFASGG